MENILQLSKIPEGKTNPCSCGSNDLTYLLYQTDQGNLWAVGCNNCGFEMKPEGKTKEEALSLWDVKMKPKKKGTAATRAKNKYNAANYDRIPLDVPKGYKNIIKAHAERMNEKTNTFIKRAIEETMARDKERK